MNDQGDIRINLLFFSVCGVHFGVDAGQVAGITVYDGEQSDDLFWFHEELGYGCDTLVYSEPAIVAIRTEDSRSYRVIIDKMEAVTEMRVMDIRPFPALLEPFVLRKGMWGIAGTEEQTILLVDFQSLLRYKGHCIKFNGGNRIC